jgi:hypothetical protein
MAKQHRHKLAPATETARVPLGFVLLYCLLETLAREQLEKLRENAAYSIQGGSLRSLNLVLMNSDST